MPFCPKCRAEYEFGIWKCADCDVPLVSKLPEEKKDELLESELVHLCTVPNEIEAILISDLLKQSEIESSYRRTILSGYVRNLLQEISNDQWNEILVLDKDYDKAEQIVDEYFKSIESKQNPLKENQDIEEADK